MQKHPSLTLGRIRSTLKMLVHDRILGATMPVKVAYCEEPFLYEKDARQSKNWKEVQPGFQYGPAYRVVWFHVTGTVPKEWQGKEVALIAELGGERTVWKNNSPDRGIDEPHALYRITDSATGAESIDLMIQAYTMNPSVRVHGYPPPRQELTDTFKKAELVTVHSELRDLGYDMEFCLSLMESQSPDDPAYATLMRGLNAVCNKLDIEDPTTIAACRKLIRNCLGSLNCEIKHSVVACGHAHLDTAWLWPLHITHHKMAHTTANQLYLMERYPSYVFCHSQASQYEWLEKEHPALFSRVKDAAQMGQWEPVGSMWVEADCNLTGAESLVRQFLYGRRYFQQHFGTTTDDMWLPDVFGYSAALPQILSKFGIKYFLTQKISWNQHNKFPHNTFWWKGIDGTRIWSHFPPADTYVGDGTPKQLIQSVKQHKDQARSDASLYLFGHGDGGGGPTEQHIELLMRATTSPALPEVEMGKKAVDFFAEARSRSRDLMTWSGELYLEMHRGTYTSQAANKKANRESEFLLRDAEWLAAFRPGFPSNYPSAKLEEAWKLVLLNQFHDIIPGSSVTEVYEDSRVDYDRVKEITEASIHESLELIGSQMDTSGCTNPYALFANAKLTTEASIPWSQEDVPNSIQCQERRYPVQLVEAFGERKLIFEVPEEALGTVAIADFCDTPIQHRSRLKARDRRIENGNWCVRFDANGNIVSITSVDDAHTEFIEPGRLANLFQIFDDRPNFWGAWDIDAFALETGRDLVKSDSFEIVERGPVRVAVEIVKHFGKSRIRQRISLGPTPGIRFDTEIDWHEDHKLLKVAFPINVNALRASYEIQFGHVERPTHQNTSWDMARFEVPAQKWADISQSDMGMALINDCKYGYDCAENVLRLSLLRAPKAPDPTCDMGLHRFSYVLLPHFDHLVNSDVVDAAYAINSPLRATRLDRHPGASISLPRLIGVDSRNLIIESVKKAEDSDHLIVRLYECHNTRGTAWLNAAMPIKRAWLCNLNEEVLSELDVVDGQTEILFNPFEILTLKLSI